MFYSKSTGGFYDSDVHGGNIPQDAVEISVSEWRSLLDGQTQGKQIVGDQTGRPVLRDAEVVQLTYAQKRASEYPPIADYLDGIVKGDEAQIAKYKADCLAVKAKYPKPS